MNEVKTWWEDNAKQYQEESNLPIDVFYGPGSPNESQLNLIGEVSGKNVLEIGCGAAHNGIAFAMKGAKVTGIDISEEQLKMARELAEKNNVDIKLYQGDIISLKPIGDESQDIVFSCWALMYVNDLSKCFQEVHRVLKENSLFVFSTEHPFWGCVGKESLKIKRSYFDVGEYKEEYMKGTFIAYYRTMNEIVNALADAGFKIEKMLEPDSRKKNLGDYWYDNQAQHRREALKWVPRTIIFKVRKETKWHKRN